MSKWSIKGSRVYGNGQSYNCINKVTAESLLNTLNTYEKTSILNKNIEQQFDKVTKELIQVKMSLSILTEDINNLASDINDLKGGE